MIEVLTVSGPPLGENSYLIIDQATRTTFIIDPGSFPDQILYLINQKQLKPKAILNTHGHFDHICYNDYLKNKLDILVYAHPLSDENRKNAPQHGGRYGFQIEPQDPTEDITEISLMIGDEMIEVIHTPGHTTGSICLYLSRSGILFSGDTLFRGNVGRTDFPGGDLNILKQSVKKLFTLPENTVVYPGHGQPTTIGQEQYYNVLRLDL